MELSPRLLRDIEFGEQWRGYNQAEVDEFLERVAVALDSLVQRFQETNARAEAAERRLLDRADGDELQRTLLLAQRTAAAAVEEAQAEAARILGAADEQVAEKQAAAEERLRSIEDEIAVRTRQELDALEARRAALAADVDALGAFVDEHRNRLAGELRRELAWLERPELEVPEPPTLQAGDVATSTPAAAVSAELAAEAEQDDDHGGAAPAHADAASLDVDGAWDEPEAATEAATSDGTDDDAGADALSDWDLGDDAPPADGGADDLAAAREELERALAGVADDPDRGDDAAAQGPGRQIFDVLAEDDAGPEPAGESTGVFDALADPDDEPSSAADVAWRDDPGGASGEGDDDPFLRELRKAITDDDPLGPRDAEQAFFDQPSEESASSGWFRRRQRD